MKCITSLALATILTTLPKQIDAKGSIELMSGNKNTTLDLRLSTSFNSKLEVFTRQIPSIDYTNKVNYFGLVGLGYNFSEDFNVFAQVQAASGSGAAPRLGIEYFKDINPVSVYAEAAAIYVGKPQIELLIDISYNHSIISDLGFRIGIEAVTLLSQNGHDFSTQKARISLTKEKLEIGPAITFEETEEGLMKNIGGSIKLNF